MHRGFLNVGNIMYDGKLYSLVDKNKNIIAFAGNDVKYLGRVPPGESIREFTRRKLNNEEEY